MDYMEGNESLAPPYYNVGLEYWWSFEFDFDLAEIVEREDFLNVVFEFVEVHEDKDQSIVKVKEVYLM